MKKIYWKTIFSKLKAFQFAAIKAIDISGDADHPLRTVARTLELNDKGTLSCWSDDLAFIEGNRLQPINIYARFVDKERGDFIMLRGESTVASFSPGKGALLHIALSEHGNCLAK